MSNQTKNNIGDTFQNHHSNEDVFIATDEFKNDAHFSTFNQYKNVYEFSVADKERFWSGEARELHWFNLWKEVRQGKAFNSKWFVGGKTNISFNCLDRHLTY